MSSESQNMHEQNMHELLNLVPLPRPYHIKVLILCITILMLDSKHPTMQINCKMK